ncbi:permease prefix domain 1-containing protein [Streptomyces sp. Ac-502]|uniref:permease prefix domain 1-containing protein n=1 Tax=Streptomyces sp. Ac-502 TaxID=3342801 RepID=UPI003862AE9F
MIDHYVAELDKALTGPRAVKADLLTEVRDGLTDAADAYEAKGQDRTSAERHVVGGFGPVSVIAPEYQAELGLSQGRRTALLICGVMLAQPVAWWALRHLATGLSDMLLSPAGLPGTLVLLGLPLAGIDASGRCCSPC